MENKSVVYLHLEHEAQQRKAFELMLVLRPHLEDADTFVQQLARQASQGYRLYGAFEGNEVIGLIGFRELENLLYGHFTYVDDLVVATSRRQLGIGAALLEVAREQGSQQECSHIVLDTGLHMPLAQRFYFREGLLARGLHFAEPLSPPQAVTHV
ncbi:GNAT family N-acetyltransferase [Pseudomonas asuensis]|uniref:N-acetyltransferase GCN5 n=1 Tax=Pseudomonas asuensis TaxID=1825787 RepID=A0ABQ2H4B8_9PSED|nr:GNAT family N-acetyltransferase [Pseudomonas asuensis]GGM29663.1 N-acetyltransferase GCN5 [Pseudomonas asuensis]